jgi:hypothetical protein
MIMFIIFCFTVSAFSSCSKKEMADRRFYYANVQGEIKQLPGTPLMDLYVNGEKKAEIGAMFGLGGTIKITAEEAMKLEFKDRSNGSLLLDTTMTLPRNQTAFFNIAYSEDIGVKGFVQERSISPDSIAFQVINVLDLQKYPYPHLDLYVCSMNFYTWDIADTVKIMPDIGNGKLIPEVVTVPVKLDADGNPKQLYIGMLKNRDTGEFITDPNNNDLNMFFLISDVITSRGKFVILPISNQYGYIGCDPIPL